MKKSGFTLIELLAVIVILAIISLIATPIVLNIINDAKESSDIRSGEFYIKSLELAIARKIADTSNGDGSELRNGEYSIIEGNLCLGTVTVVDEKSNCNGDLLEVEMNGEAPKEGKVVISDGQIAYVEGLKIGSSDISTGINGELIKSKTRVLCESVTKETRLNSKYYPVDSFELSTGKVTLSNTLKYVGNIPAGKYEPGDEYLCEVKPGTIYRFYILSKDGDNINLIMDQNITSNGSVVTSSDSGYVEWINQSDYESVGGTNWNVGGKNGGNQEKGPLTAMQYLYNATKDWRNISENTLNLNQKTIYLKNSGITYGSNGYTMTISTRARMATIEEVFELGCRFENDKAGFDKYSFYDTCPMFLTNNLKFKRDTANGQQPPKGATVIENGPRGYWLMTGLAHEDLIGVGYVAYEILDHGNINSKPVNTNNYNGVRPVITLNKTYLK